MARRPRHLVPSGTYHVTSRGNERRSIFRDDADRRRFSALLGRIGAEREWSITTYCWMPNHVHLLVRPPCADLSDGMQELLGSYARWHNDRHGRVGHLFQGRFHARAVVREAHHRELFRYLALNPVRAGLVRRPEAFAWSAHTALLGVTKPPPFLDPVLEPFEGDCGRYARFVADASGDSLRDLLGDGSAERLRAALDAGFSQARIARALGCSRATVGRRLA